jgi:hypothetical protein
MIQLKKITLFFSLKKDQLHKSLPLLWLVGA